uniref:EGF-like domain-containing protein n=1 Tax=Rhabditophanes sp. KR3021 TaxID=114890 RepID=A0AC35TRD5_9BILA
MLQNPISNILNTGVSSKVVYVGKACDSYPCWNNGICLPTDTINGYTCVCNEFYNGVHCENKVSATFLTKDHLHYNQNIFLVI